MIKSALLATIGIAATMALLSSTNVAGATNSSSTTCETVKVSNINSAKPSQNRINYTFNVTGQGGRATAQVVAGDNCTGKTMSLVSYKAPTADGRPYTAQTIFAHQTKVTSTNVATFDIKVPDCFYQVDLVKGQPLDLSTGKTYSSTGSLVAHKNSGTKACTVGGSGGATPTPAPSASPTPAPVVTPAPSPTPTPVVGGSGDANGVVLATSTAPVQLPVTGVATNATLLLGLTAAIAAFAAARRYFKN